MKKLAYLVPTYNGGALLAETVRSPAAAGLPPDLYQVLVIDNQSTDGAPQALPSHDSQGVPIRVIVNESNLGRIGNLNRAMEIAQREGFEYATYLMIGDGVHGKGVVDLVALMEQEQAVLGMGYFHFVDEHGKYLRQGRRLSWDITGGIKAKPLIAQSVAIGAQIIGIVQGNLYRIGSGRLPRFDADNPALADHVATWRFALEADAPIVYCDVPIFDWRKHAGRFHMGMDLVDNSERERQMIVEICGLAGVEPDWTRIKTSMLLRRCFHLLEGYTKAGRLDTMLRFLKWTRTVPGHISPVAMAAFVAAYAKRKSMFGPFTDPGVSG